MADLPLMMGVSADSLAVGMDGNRFTSETGIAMLDPWIAGPNYFSIWSAEHIDDIVSNGLATAVQGPAVGFLGHRGSIPSGTPLPEAYQVLDDAIERGYVSVSYTHLPVQQPIRPAPDDGVRRLVHRPAAGGSPERSAHGDPC